MNGKRERYDEVYRGVQRARALRNAHFKLLAGRFVTGNGRRFTRRTKSALVKKIDSLQRSTFTSMI